MKQKEVKELIRLETEPDAITKVELLVNSEETFPQTQAPTATQLLSSIEKVAQEYVTSPQIIEEETSVCVAQAKLTQSIASAARNNPDHIMNDINLNNTVSGIFLVIFFMIFNFLLLFKHITVL